MDALQEELITFGAAATRLGLQWHHVARLATRKLIPFVAAGHVRLLRVADLERVREAARNAGYLKEAEPVAS